MGFLRVRRSVRLLPGVRLNFSKSGVSTSIGGRGAHVTIGNGHVRKTVGIPGTGVSYTTVSGHKRRGQRQSRSSGGATLIGLIVVGYIVLSIIKTLMH